MGLFLQFGCLILASIPAGIHNIVYLKKKKFAPSFFVGYLVAYYLIIWPLFFALETFGVAGATLGPALQRLFFGAVIFSSIGVACLLRKQAFFYIGSFMTFNIPIWICTIIYVFTGAKKVWQRNSIPPALPHFEKDPLIITHDGNNQLEPMSLRQICNAVATGRLSNDNFFWNERLNEWRLISEINIYPN